MPNEHRAVPGDFPHQPEYAGLVRNAEKLAYLIRSYTVYR